MPVVQYKLTYFDLRSLAECARLIFAYAEIPYEDHRVPLKPDDYKGPKNQPNTPFGQLPMLEVNGKKLAQSGAINRYLARQYGLTGKTPFEDALVNSIADAFKDFMLETRPYFIAVLETRPYMMLETWPYPTAIGFTEDDKDQLYENLRPAAAKLFMAINEFLQNSDSGFLVGDSVTWADFLIAERLDCFREYAPKLLDGYPEIRKWMYQILHIPQIKNWMDNRPDTKF